MKTNLIWAAIVTAALTGGLYWLLNIEFAWNMPFWFYLIVFVMGLGSTLANLGQEKTD